MSYAVREAAPTDVEAELVALWTANLNMGGDPRDKYRWFYVGNPLGHARAFMVETAGSQGTRVVGSCGLGSRTLRGRNGPLRAGLLADFALDRDHRTVLPGIMLQRALAARAREAFELTYAFPNDAAIGILSRIGYRLLGRTGRYVRLLRVDAILERFVRSRALARLLALVPNLVLDWTDRAKAATLPRGLELEWTRDPDARFDELWARVGGRYGCQGERSSRFLRWRFTHRPGLPGELAALVDRETGRLVAYAALVEKVKGVALIADFLAESEDALVGLLRRLFPALRERGFQQAKALFLGAPAIESLLRDVGFSFRGQAKNVVVDAGPAALSVLRTDDWYLTEADRDN